MRWLTLTADAVSYTHLDVYKRQIIALAVGCPEVSLPT